DRTRASGACAATSRPRVRCRQAAVGSRRSQTTHRQGTSAMPTSLLRPLLAAAAFLGALAPAAQAATSLSEQVRVAGATPGPVCQDGPRPGAGTVTRQVRTAAGGLVVARLGAAGGDWDLAVFDAATGERVAASSGFGADEVAVGFARRAGDLL